jgi:hypothetical protein
MELESIDQILRNLEKDPDFYNHATPEQFNRFDNMNQE